MGGAAGRVSCSLADSIPYPHKRHVLQFDNRLGAFSTNSRQLYVQSVNQFEDAVCLSTGFLEQSRLLRAYSGVFGVIAIEFITAKAPAVGTDLMTM